MPRKTQPALDDPDNPEWTEGDFARAKRVDELTPEVRDAITAAFPKTRGRPKKLNAKQVVTLRLRPDLIAAYQARSAHWRGEMESALARAIERSGGNIAGEPGKAKVKTPKAAPSKSRLKGEWKAP